MCNLINIHTYIHTWYIHTRWYLLSQKNVFVKLAEQKANKVETDR